jgi:hypothetical protein
MVGIAIDAPKLAVPALAAVVRTGQVGTASRTPQICTACWPDSACRFHNTTSMALAAPRAHSLPGPHIALLHALQFNWFANDADSEAVNSLPLLAKPIGDVLRRPGVIHDLHAAEPYAAVSLVLAVLQAVFSLPKTPLGDELRRQAQVHMRGAAGHCLE